MNICKWCNAKVADHDTVWYRRNLVLGYSFCSNKCATQWKNSNQVASNDGNSNNKTVDDLRYEREEKIFRQEKNELENIETARKTMTLIRKVLPHWKIIIPALIVLLVIAFFLNKMCGQILLYIYILLILGIVWAFYTEPKE